MVLASSPGHCSGLDPRQGVLGLLEQLARVVAQRELMLPLEQLRARVGLVVPGLGEEESTEPPDQPG